MAITAIAPMSSVIATARRKSFAPGGTFDESSATIPRAKAMSVAMGIPQPRIASVPAPALNAM